MTQRILRLKEVKLLTGLSRSTIYRYISMNLFPNSISLGMRSVGWLENEVDQWRDQRISATRSEHKE